MAMSELELRLEAVERYLHSARQAEIKDLWARITGKNCSLLKFEEVANRLHIRQQIPIGHQMVRLNQIVGSVGRYREFTKEFLPRATILQDRWVAVDVTLNSLQGLPPIDLYKIGGAYFVIDGNHRISVSRANGNKDIEARVIECQTGIPFTLKDFTSGKWRLKSAYEEFLTQTRLDQLRPGVKLDVTDADHFPTILQHIAVHHYLSNLSNRPQRTANGTWGEPHLSWGDAVVSWVDTVYTPIVEAIRSHKIMAQFPKRTETDLYIAITQYRERVAEEYELAPLCAQTAVTVFAANHNELAIGRLFLAMCQLLDRSVGEKVRWVLGQVKLLPTGMTNEEFGALRLRHDAGELSLIEAGRKVTQEVHFA